MSSTNTEYESDNETQTDNEYGNETQYNNASILTGLNTIINIGTIERVYTLARVSTKIQSDTNSSLDTQTSNINEVLKELKCPKNNKILHKRLVGTAYNYNKELDNFYSEFTNKTYKSIIIVNFADRFSRNTEQATEIVNNINGRIIFYSIEYGKWLDTQDKNSKYQFLKEIDYGHFNSKRQSTISTNNSRKRKFNENQNTSIKKQKTITYLTNDVINQNIYKTLQLNNTDSTILHKIMSWIYSCIQGGTNVQILGEFKKLITMDKFINDKNYELYCNQQFEFIGYNDPLNVKQGELDFDYILNNLIGWRIDFPLKINNKTVKWSTSIIEYLYEFISNEKDIESKLKNI